MAHRDFDWNGAKQKILNILESDLSEEKKKEQIESLLKSLPFPYNLNNHEFSYNSCGYPYWATHKRFRQDSFKLREILDDKFDSETFEFEYFCPRCKKFASHKE